MHKLDPLLWFNARKMDYGPKHFVRSNTLLTEDSKKWIEETLTGRYYLSSFEFGSMLIEKRVVSFEDPAEATFYELTWS